MKFFKRLVASILLLGFLVAPSIALAQKNLSTNESTESAKVEKVNSFELFWPIVAGKVGGEPLYFLKSLKETLREALIFSDFKKADYTITLSEKRTVEAEKLFLTNRDYTNAAKSLSAAQARRGQAFALTKKSEEQGRRVQDLKNRMMTSFDNQKQVFAYIAVQTPDDQKKILQDNIEAINALLKRLQ